MTYNLCLIKTSIGRPGALIMLSATRARIREYTFTSNDEMVVHKEYVTLIEEVMNSYLNIVVTDYDRGAFYNRDLTREAMIEYGVMPEAGEYIGRMPKDFQRIFSSSRSPYIFTQGPDPVYSTLLDIILLSAECATRPSNSEAATSLWFYAPPGSGKSTVEQSIALLQAYDKRLDNLVIYDTDDGIPSAKDLKREGQVSLVFTNLTDRRVDFSAVVLDRSSPRDRLKVRARASGTSESAFDVWASVHAASWIDKPYYSFHPESPDMIKRGLLISDNGYLTLSSRVCFRSSIKLLTVE